MRALGLPRSRPREIPVQAPVGQLRGSLGGHLIAKFFGDDVSPYVVVQREEFRPLGLHKRSIRDALQVGELNSTNNRADIFATSICQRGSLWYE